MKEKTSIRLIQCNGVTTVTASFPTDHAKKFGLSVISSALIWVGSYFLPSLSLPPVNPPPQTAQPTIGK